MGSFAVYLGDGFGDLAFKCGEEDYHPSTAMLPLVMRCAGASSGYRFATAVRNMNDRGLMMLSEIEPYTTTSA